MLNRQEILRTFSESNYQDVINYVKKYSTIYNDATLEQYKQETEPKRVV